MVRGADKTARQEEAELPDRDHAEVAHMDHHEWVDHVGSKLEGMTAEQRDAKFSSMNEESQIAYNKTQVEKYYQLEDALALKSPEQVEKYWAAIKDPTVRQHYNEIIASRPRPKPAHPLGGMLICC
mmetsp:Transcript_30974/g.71609  ORF Transcript_30974/g.71609 Transcript_30974/m.71609 type:complete len:126 (-) Transcript_30974:186-563(-)